MAQVISIVCFYIVPLAVMLLASWWLVRITARSLNKELRPLIITIFLVQFVTLFHATFIPGQGDIFIIFGRQDAYVSGWPFAWFGVNSLEVLFVPFYIAANTLLWTGITCLILFCSKQLVTKLHREYSRRVEIIALSIVVVLGILLPFLFIPLNAIGSVP